MLNEDERSGFPNDELTHSLIFGVPAGVPTVVPPWPSDTRALEQREFLASQLRKAATQTPQNGSQFAVWSLNIANLFIHFPLLLST
jgi:hypothetical protein